MPDDIQLKAERARQLERARLEKGWTKKQLAERAGYDEKTLYNLLNGGDVQAKTARDFFEAAGTAMPLSTIRRVEVAADQLGGYSRSIYSEYEGGYAVYRPRFSTPGQIYRYRLTIAWDAEEDRFRFTAFYKADAREPDGAHRHSGPMSIAAMTNLIHFTTMFRGSVRLVTVTKMRRADGTMRGAMLTHYEDLNGVRPTLSPVVIRKVDEGAAVDAGSFIRPLDASDPDYAFARDQLSVTEANLLNLCFGTRG